MPEVTIIMYHYVRELPLTRYPEIKGLRVSEFEHQLNYLERRYNFVTVEQCIEAIYGSDSEFPEKAALLTFDDGYLEHYTEVFPILDARGIQGAFFPPVQAIIEHKVLDVNKIHFILASTNGHSRLMHRINSRISELRGEYGLKNPEYYVKKLSDSEHRYDSPEVVYIKRILQRELPEEPRKIILDELFTEYVGIDEKIFARELYMSMDQIKCMLRHGMFVGGHGYSHRWLNAMDAKEQKGEVEKTRAFLNHLNIPTNEWVMCYPYGAYDENLVNILKTEDCVLGIGTDVGIAKLNQQNAFSLKRMDTNDFPKKKMVSPLVHS